MCWFSALARPTACGCWCLPRVGDVCPEAKRETFWDKQNGTKSTDFRYPVHGWVRSSHAGDRRRWQTGLDAVFRCDRFETNNFCTRLSQLYMVKTKFVWKVQSDLWTRLWSEFASDESALADTAWTRTEIYRRFSSTLFLFLFFTVSRCRSPVWQSIIRKLLSYFLTPYVYFFDWHF